MGRTGGATKLVASPARRPARSTPSASMRSDANKRETWRVEPGCAVHQARSCTRWSRNRSSSSSAGPEATTGMAAAITLSSSRCFTSGATDLDVSRFA